MEQKKRKQMMIMMTKTNKKKKVVELIMQQVWRRETVVEEMKSQEHQTSNSEPERFPIESSHYDLTFQQLTTAWQPMQASWAMKSMRLEKRENWMKIDCVEDHSMMART